MTTQKLFFPLFLVALLLTGVSCTPTDTAPETPDDAEDDSAFEYDYDDSDFEADYFQYTEHGSRINLVGVDEAMVGTWELDLLEIAGGAVESPFFGHTMTFSTDSTVSQNFATEQYDGAAASISDCEISGSTSAYGRTVVSYLDSVDEEGNVIDTTVLTYFNIYNKTGGSEVECTGLSGDTVSSSHQSAQLGTGPAESDSFGVHVPYYYEMSESWDFLTLYLGEPDDGAYIAKYNYSRLSGPYPFPDGYDGS